MLPFACYSRPGPRPTLDLMISSGWSEGVLATGTTITSTAGKFGFTGEGGFCVASSSNKSTLLKRGEDLMPETPTKEEKLSYSHPLGTHF